MAIFYFRVDLCLSRLYARLGLSLGCLEMNFNLLFAFRPSTATLTQSSHAIWVFHGCVCLPWVTQLVLSLLLWELLLHTVVLSR